ncbi:MAG TPA: hypothetical protein VFO89_06365 [Thermoanaerobaculia bacterium]|nr:hypothetical protein [Thermoanaerobaculia bacterium]
MAPTPSAQLLAAYASDPDFAVTLNKVTGFAAVVLRRGGRTTGLDEADDYVQQAVKLVLEGRRNLPPDATPRQIRAALYGIVESLIYHHRRKLRRRGRFIPIASEPGDGQISEQEIVEKRDDEAERAARQSLKSFLAKIDARLRRYALARVADPDATADQHARYQRVPVAAIRAMDKRLRRRRDLWGD